MLTVYCRTKICPAYFSSGSTGDYELVGDAFWDRAAKPAFEHAVATGIGDLPNRTSGVVPPVVDLIMPDVGAIGSRVWSQYRTWSTVIDVFGSDNPAQAGIDWYKDQWWNPASEYLDDFLTLGGMYEQRDARIHPICGLRQGLGLFFGL